ncbi:MAG: DNA translocase FtsK 4TM domain-containing protein [Clostridia bacterium]|nr:DNA translocase FtsK 4TM domain-containing protein [Clostridia bacterium]
MARKVVRKKTKATVSTPRKSKKSNPAKKETLTIVFSLLGIIFIMGMWSEFFGAFGDFLKSVFCGLLGNVAYLLPVVLIAEAVLSILSGKENNFRSKKILTGIMPVSFSMFAHYLYRIGDPVLPENGVIGYFNLGNTGESGGIIGGTLTDILYSFMSKGSGVVIIAIILILAVQLFEISVTSLIRKAFTGFRRAATGLKEDIQEDIRHDREQREAEKKVDSVKIEFADHQLEEYKWDHSDEEVVINDVLAANDDEEDKPEELSQTPAAEKAEEESAAVESGEITPIEIEEPPIIKEYIPPKPELLYEGPKVHSGGKIDELKDNAAKLVEIFRSFGIETRVTNITRGSSVTRYEVVPAAGIKVNKITALDQDIALRLPANNVRIEVLPGYVGVEVSNDSVSAVYLRSIIDSPEFRNATSKLAVAVGRDINGATVVMDIAKTPHLLIAGATGSGKSVCINTMITSILYNASPEEVKLILVDPKVVELSVYNDIPHLLVPIVTDPRKAAGALCWAVQEMEDRYKKFAEVGSRDIAGYNKKIAADDAEKRPLPQIVIIIDELADLMMVAPGEVQDYICRLAQKARAAGMHLVLATQRPSVDVITGLIKANIPSRIAFAVSSSVDSRTILDGGGAEKLMGKGDMLMMLAGASKLNRVQGAFVSDTDVENVVNFIKQQSAAEYNEEVRKTIENSGAAPSAAQSDDGADSDELFEAAAEIAFELGQISASMIQRRLKVGYARAGRLLDILDKKKVVSSYDGSNKPRQLIMSRQDFNDMLEKEGDQ